jgi:hypothetical protein
MAFADIFKDSNEYNEKNHHWIYVLCSDGNCNDC